MTVAATHKPVKRYKQFLVVLSALYPLTVLVTWAFVALFGDGPGTVPFLGELFIRTFVEAALIVALLVFVVLPSYTRLARRWLFES